MARTKNRYNPVRKFEILPDRPSRIWHTALYARLSVELIPRKSESIENQLELMRKFTADRPEFTELTEYTDKGFSGTDFHRPAFEKMMEDIRCGRINCVIVKDLSRLGRDYLETSGFVEVIFPFLGVRFISVNDHFDTLEDQNENKDLEIALKNLVNDMYARDISKRVSVLKVQEQERGRFLGSAAPYGYKIDTKHPLRQLIIDEPAAEVVRNIYNMVIEGKTIRQISLILQERNLSIPGQYSKTGHLYREPGDKAAKWYKGTIAAILHNQAYIGNLVQRRSRQRHYMGEEHHFTEKEEWMICENTHEPILSREVYERVQNILKKNAEESTFSSQRTADVLIRPNRFQGILFCGICGEKLLYHSIVRGGNMNRRYSYTCADSCNLQIEKHKGIYIVEETLDSILKEMIGSLLRSFNGTAGELTDMMNAELQRRTSDRKREIRKTEARIKDLDAVSASQYEAYVLGTLSGEKYRVLQSDAEEQRRKLEQEIGSLQEKCRKYESDVRDRTEWLLGLSAASEGEPDEELLHLLIDRIELYPDHELKITWRFAKEDILEYLKGVKENGTDCNLSASL